MATHPLCFRTPCPDQSGGADLRDHAANNSIDLRAVLSPRLATMGTDRTDVHIGGREPANVGQQLVLGMMGQIMGLGDRQVWIGCDVGLRPQAVSDPTDAQLSNLFDAFDRSDSGGGLVNQGRVDRVYQASANLLHRRTQNADDRDGDAQTNDGICPAPTERNTAGAEKHGEAGEPVSASVQAVSNKGS